MVKTIIQDFLDKELGKLIKDDYIYNEFSLQHELGIYLRNELGGNYKVQFERNVDDVFGKGVVKSVKKEMDIYIENMNDAKERYAIELKFPRNGQYPVQMYYFVKDIQFMEDVKKLGTTPGTYVITLVDDVNFYNKGKSFNGIYEYFRENKGRKPKVIDSLINPLTGLSISGSHQIEWTPVLLGGTHYKPYKYYFVEI